MAQSVAAVVSDIFREKLARIYVDDAGLGAFSLPFQFKMGEGGWTDPGGGKEPLPPDATLTDVTAGTGMYVSPGDYIFTKALVPASDFTFVASTRAQIRCLTLTGEANDDGYGNPPEFFELGIFDAAGNMLVYSTYPLEVKTASKALEHIIFIDF
jgi:hypothetical protein